MQDFEKWKIPCTLIFMPKCDYILTVGLEIHAELKTRTKMFCDSKNDPDESRPNVNICPICLGHPGTLPVINKDAVRHILKVGLALGGRIADFTEFDRKNYFYPDIPKGYQLSQYEFPLVTNGEFNGVAVTRVHLEEDTATSIHDSGITSRESSLVDFNRAGVPLMELVTEPMIRSAKEAGDFAREFQLLLRYLGVSDANMEKGEMRVEANISVSRERGAFGTKVEVKNLNSFRAVEKAIAYEMNRHIELLESGGMVTQETRGWDESEEKTFGQRSKEEAQDYRYFPDPDLPKLLVADVPEFVRAILEQEIPELPAARRRRFRESGLKEEDAATLVANRSLGALFEGAVKELSGKEELTLAANYLTSDLLGLLKKAGVEADTAALPFSGPAFAELIHMATEKKLSSRGTKDVLAAMFARGGTPKEIAAERNLLQNSDAGELAAVVDGIIAAHGKVADDYRNGRAAALQFLVGQGMKATRGAANPAILGELFASRLK